MDIDKTRLLLAAQKALLGAIGPQVLAIYVGAREGYLTMTVFTETNIPEDHKEAIEEALTEIYADYPFAAYLDHIHFLEGQEPPFSADGWLVFLRYGCTVVNSNC